MAKSADAFRTISEVAEWLGVQTHVLRFWESKFTQVKPVKRAGGRRYYRPFDMHLLGGIQKLLHEDGLTIKGVQKILREKGIAHVSALSPKVDDLDETSSDLAPETIAPAPMDVAEPIMGEVVPLVFDTPKSNAVNRPSFTDDVIVEPDTSNSSAKADADNEATSIFEEKDAPNADVVAKTDLGPVEGVAEADLEPVEMAAEDVSDVSSQETEAQSTDQGSDAEQPATIETVERSADEDDVDAVQAAPYSADTTATDIETDTDRDTTDTSAGDLTEPSNDNLERAAAEVSEQDDAAQKDDELAALDSPIASPAEIDDPKKSQFDPFPVLPSFLSRSTMTTKAPIATTETDNPPPTAQTVASVPVSDPKDLEVVKPDAPQEPTEPTAPKPNVIAAPDTPNETDIVVSGRTLSALAKIKSLTPSQAREIAPLVAQLREKRDRMSQGRKE